MIPATALVPEDAFCRYDEHGEPALSHSEQILLRLRWWGHDWCSREDLVIALDVPREEIYAFDKALERLVTSGRVERHGDAACYFAYRLGHVLAAPRPAPSDEDRRRARYAARQAWREKQRQAGLCSDCKEPAARGTRLCEGHLEAAARRRAA